MIRQSDPLGLTTEQRTWSNVLGVFRGREAWWPPEVSPIVEAHIRDDACENCRAIDDHAPDCLGLLANTLHELGQELSLSLATREDA